MLDMTNDSHLFQIYEEMEAAGLMLRGNRFVGGEKIYRPLYEAKFIQQFDHRNGTFEGISKSNLFKARAGTKTPFFNPVTR